MPQAKMRDAYIVRCLRELLKKYSINDQMVNDKPMPGTMFVTWVVTSLHLQISHLRTIKQFQNRYAYRLSKLNQESMEKLQGLLDVIIVASDDKCTDLADTASTTSDHSDSTMVATPIAKVVAKPTVQRPGMKYGGDARYIHIVPNMFTDNPQLG